MIAVGSNESYTMSAVEMTPAEMARLIFGENAVWAEMPFTEFQQLTKYTDTAKFFVNFSVEHARFGIVLDGARSSGLHITPFACSAHEMINMAMILNASRTAPWN